MRPTATLPTSSKSLLHWELWLSYSVSCGKVGRERRSSPVSLFCRCAPPRYLLLPSLWVSRVFLASFNSASVTPYVSGQKRMSDIMSFRWSMWYLKLQTDLLGIILQCTWVDLRVCLAWRDFAFLWDSASSSLTGVKYDLVKSRWLGTLVSV